MARTDGRHNSHVQESRPTPAGRSAAPAEVGQPAAPEESRAGWRAAALVWAIIFLFLWVLMLLDLVYGWLLH